MYFYFTTHFIVTLLSALNYRRYLLIYLSAVGPSSPGAVNTRPPAVAVYIAFADGRRAVAKFPKSGVWDKVPEGSSLILEIPEFPQNTALHGSMKTCTRKNQLDPCSRFDTITACDRQTHRHTTTANTRAMA